MSQKSVVVLAGTCLFMCFSARATFLTRWTGAGANSLWTNPTNWDRLAVPNVNTDVIITNTGGQHVVLNVDTTVASVTVGGGSTLAVLDLAGVNLHADGVNFIGTNGTIEVISNSSFFSTNGLQNSGTIYVPANSGTVSLALNCNFSNSRTIDVETNSTLRLTTSSSVTYTFITGTAFPGPGTVQFAPGNEALHFNGNIAVSGNIEMQQGIYGYCNWTGPGLFRWEAGGFGGVTFAPDFHVELAGGGGIFDNCTNQGSIRVIGTNDLAFFYGTFYNQGLFQIESNCVLENFGGGGFVNSGTIKVPGGLGTQTLALNCNFTNSGIIDVETNSTLQLPDNAFAQTIFLDGSTFDGAGTIRFLGNNNSLECHGLMTVNGTVEYQKQNGIFGSSLWTGPGLLRFEAGGISSVIFAPDFHTEISGTFAVFTDCTNQGPMHLVGTNDWYMIGGTFFNTGSFQIESNCNFQTEGFPGGFANIGTILLPAGLGTQSVSIGCNFTNAGIFDVETNSTLNLTGFNNQYTFLLNDGTTFAGPGTIRFSGTDGVVACNGMMNVNGIIELQQPMVPILGWSTWTGPGLFRWQAGPISQFKFAPDFHVEISGIATVYSDCTNQGSIRALGSNYMYIPGGTFHNSGLFQIETNFYLQSFFFGNFENSGTIRVPMGLGLQTWTFDSCLFTNTGTIAVDSGSTLAMSATNNLASDTVFSFLDGTVLAGSGTLQLVPGQIAISCTGTMNVSNTVEFNSQFIMYGPSKWTGPGLLRWLNGGIVGFTFASDFHTEISGPGWKFLSLSCTNQGTLRWLGGGNLAGGYLSPEILYNEGLLQVETDGFWWDFALTNQPGGTFRQLGGTLTVDSFANEGTARLERGALNVQKTFSSGTNSLYQVFLGGTTSVANFNLLSATNLVLGGSLQVILTNNFSPANGDTFTITTNLSQAGTFNSTALPSLPLPLAWNVQYLPNSVVLAVNAQPLMITSPSFVGGQFQFSFTGPAAAAYDIQVSTNLMDWTSVQSNSPFSGAASFSDTNSTNFDRRYYRLRIFE